MRVFMDVYEGLRISFRALRANKLRAALTTLGILIGVTTVVLMVTIILGLNKAVAGQFSFLGTNTLYVSKWDWFGENWRAMIKRPKLEVDDADRVRAETTLGVAVSPMADTQSSVSYRSNRLTNVEIFGVGTDYVETNSVRLDQGRFFNDDEVRRNVQVCVVGSSIAERLFPDGGALDKKLDINGQKFRIIGVNAKMGRFFGQNMDDFVYLPIGAFIKRFVRESNVDIVVKARSAEEVNDLEWELRGIMRRVRKLGPLEPDNFGINGQNMIMDAYRKITGSIYAGGVIIAFISLLVGGIGIMNIMLVSVTERTSEVGL
ncbi:MAG: ABC transporter permease, partial [bacterium]|nr:ABC transporter permease [bacterium]